jgi:hypothetical protein
VRTGNGELLGKAISLPCYLWPADLGFRAALTKLIEDRVRVSEHIAMRPGPDTFSIEVLSLSRKAADVALEPQTQPTRPWPARKPPTRCWPGPVHSGPGTTMSFRSRTAPRQSPGIMRRGDLCSCSRRTISCAVL